MRLFFIVVVVFFLTACFDNGAFQGHAILDQNRLHNTSSHIGSFPYPYQSVLLLTHDVDSIDAYNEGMHLFEQNERANGVKSTFFLTVWDYDEVNETLWAKDPDYQGVIWQPENVRRMSSDIGSHARHHYKKQYLQEITYEQFVSDELLYSKRAIESVSSHKVMSFRSPYLTYRGDYLFKGLSEAGYQVDMSLTDEEAGTCMPFYQRGILEIPTTMPDDSLLFFDRNPSKIENGSVKTMLDKLDIIHKQKCIFNALIHPSRGGLHSIQEKWDVEQKLIDRAKEHNMWITDVSTFYQWWHTRSQLILEKLEKRWVIINPTNSTIKNVVVIIDGKNIVVDLKAGQRVFIVSEQI